MFETEVTKVTQVARFLYPEDRHSANQQIKQEQASVWGGLMSMAFTAGFALIVLL